MELIGQGLACMRGGRQVFSDLGFRVGEGEALHVVGPNGAGKSSLLRLVAGLLRPAAGRIALVGGEPELSVSEQAHYLGHEDALKHSLSVWENLRFWACFLGGASFDERNIQALSRHDSTPAPRDKKRSAHLVSPSPERGGPNRERRSGEGSGAAADPLPELRSDLPLSGGGSEKPALSGIQAALAAVGLDELAELPAAYLSAGQRRRLSIARLVAVPRRLWLLDEPTAALDVAAQRRLAELMRRHLADDGLILVATHGPIGLDGAKELRLGGQG